MQNSDLKELIGKLHFRETTAEYIQLLFWIFSGRVFANTDVLYVSLSAGGGAAFQHEPHGGPCHWWRHRDPQSRDQARDPRSHLV